MSVDSTSPFKNVQVSNFELLNSWKYNNPKGGLVGETGDTCWNLGDVERLLNAEGDMLVF